MKNIEVAVPDIGKFEDVSVIEVHVKPGDVIRVEEPLITLESDKASLDIPSPYSGIVKAVTVKVGDKVSKGSKILLLEVTGQEGKEEEGKREIPCDLQSNLSSLGGGETTAISLAPSRADAADIHAQVLVLGAGPGGYTAAFRAADLGKKVVLVERYPTLGGVCLNVGCIPSKALLHAAKVIIDVEDMAEHGLSFGKPELDLERLRAWKTRRVVGQLTAGLEVLAKQRQVTVVRGEGRFMSPHQLAVTQAHGKPTVVSFDHAIIAAGSKAVQMPGLPPEHQRDPRIMDSSAALELEEIPRRLLVIGGGIIGLEMGTFYDAFGSQVSIVELSEGLIPGCDRDLVRPLQKRLEKRFADIMVNTRVAKLEPRPDGVHVSFEGEQAIEAQVYDRVLVAIGRRPNGKSIGCEAAGVFVDEQGFIPVDKQMRTNVPHIFAVGDIVGQPMLAHKAVHQGKTAAEVIAGCEVEFQALAIPSVAYTDPEVAWAGITESEAKARGIEIEKASFPWAASGRALSMGRSDGLTKLILDRDTRRIIGVGIVGPAAGELLAEAVLAIEMGANTEDVGLTIHAHPTLSETLYFAAEMAEGTITDLLPHKKR